MKRNAVFCILLAAALLPCTLSSADFDVPAVGARGDEVLRLQTRLFDLGWQLETPSGVWRTTDDMALSGCLARQTADARTLEALFSANVALPGEADEPALRDSGVYGGLMPWSEAKTRLIAGQSYLITDYQSGIAVHLQYLGGDGYAVLRPALSWDSATMEGLFTDTRGMETRPVIVTIDGMLAAGALRLDPFSTDSSGFLRVKLYFSGSSAALGGITDVECERAVRTASGK